MTIIRITVDKKVDLVGPSISREWYTRTTVARKKLVTALLTLTQQYYSGKMF